VAERFRGLDCEDANSLGLEFALEGLQDTLVFAKGQSAERLPRRLSMTISHPCPQRLPNLHCIDRREFAEAEQSPVARLAIAIPSEFDQTAKRSPIQFPAERPGKGFADSPVWMTDEIRQEPRYVSDS